MGSDSTTFRGHPVLNAPEMVKENLQRGGYVVADGERVYFQKGCDRRRAVVIDLARTELISADDFPAREDGEEDVGWAGY